MARPEQLVASTTVWHSAVSGETDVRGPDDSDVLAQDQMGVHVVRLLNAARSARAIEIDAKSESIRLVYVNEDGEKATWSERVRVDGALRRREPTPARRSSWLYHRAGCSAQNGHAVEVTVTVRPAFDLESAPAEKLNAAVNFNC